ncbi:hypothetical protein AGMMS49940_04350 [Spirochaetia bacterium]|nr:hypothetical protein AGMMS49940_04350 [Spirochaetia bacterium]
MANFELSTRKFKIFDFFLFFMKIQFTRIKIKNLTTDLTDNTDKGKDKKAGVRGVSEVGG